MTNRHHEHRSPHHEHKEKAPIRAGCAVITVSDTRTEATDTSGGLIRELLAAQGHAVQAYHIVPDEPSRIRPLLEQFLRQDGIDAVIVNGGTGISPRDVTYDTVAGMLEKTLPGFGELFRHLSFQEIGAAALLSRATAGVVGTRVVFSVPGSTAAVRLAMERLILPELGHILGQLRK
jgi:molybdenum cofactor biosynthesis protein B